MSFEIELSKLFFYVYSDKDANFMTLNVYFYCIDNKYIMKLMKKK